MSLRGKTTISSTASAEKVAQIRKIADTLLPEDIMLLTDELETRMSDLRKAAEDVLKLGEKVQLTEKILSPEEQSQLLKTLQNRFENHMNRHQGVEWHQVQSRLEQAPKEKFWSLHEMERTGGEPDVIGIDEKTAEVIFVDCSAGSPSGRRNLVYDRAAEETTKEECDGNAVEMAESMGIELLSERQYRELQKKDGKFDNNLTMSWLKIREEERTAGHALLGEGREGEGAFIYYDKPGYFCVRLGFRGLLRV